MTAEADIRGVLIGSTSVAALSSNRVYSGILPENVTFPTILLTRTDTELFPCMGSDSALKAGFFTIDCWAAHSSDARDLATKASSALQRYGSSTGTVTIDTVFILNQKDSDEELDVDENTFLTYLDLKVWYRE